MWLATVCIGVTAIFLASYFGPLLYCYLKGPQDLKKKYNADWALVTGGSSGLGRALVERCASQGLNVVIVALDDAMLQEAADELSSKYANLSFRPVGCDLTKPDGDKGYMTAIKRATEDIDVRIVFLNAGYLVLKFFGRESFDVWQRNLDCNVMSGLRISHHFMQKMRANGKQTRKQGCLVFTTSSSAYFPSPLASIYGAGKSLLIQFATSLSVEGHAFGVEVTAAAPGYMTTRLYEKSPKLDMFNVFRILGDTPETIAGQIFSGIGRVTIFDCGVYSYIIRVIANVIHANPLIPIIGMAMPYSKDAKDFPDLL